MVLTALLLGAAIGLVLALTGAGGGVLAIPLLVFGLQLPVQQAAPVGLLAVGLAAALGALLGLRDGMVRYRAAGLIGLTGMLLAPAGVALAQRLPNRPLLAAFALVLLYTAWRTLGARQRDRAQPADVACRVNAVDRRLTWTGSCARALAATGALSGVLSGLLGVGGGFVIVPALSSHTDLEVRSIHATSLAVIALVSVGGVSAAAWHGSLLWPVALPFAAGAALALLVGRRLAARLRPASLQRAFAWFSVVVAALMLARASGGLSGL